MRCTRVAGNGFFVIFINKRKLTKTLRKMKVILFLLLITIKRRSHRSSKSQCIRSIETTRLELFYRADARQKRRKSCTIKSSMTPIFFMLNPLHHTFLDWLEVQRSICNNPPDKSKVGFENHVFIWSSLLKS
jgi:hypothetical protein